MHLNAGDYVARVRYDAGSYSVEMDAMRFVPVDTDAQPDDWGNIKALY